MLQEEAEVPLLTPPSGKRARTDAYVADTSIPDLPAVQEAGHADQASAPADCCAHLGKRAKPEKSAEVKLALCVMLLGRLSTPLTDACETTV